MDALDALDAHRATRQGVEGRQKPGAMVLEQGSGLGRHIESRAHLAGDGGALDRLATEGVGERGVDLDATPTRDVRIGGVTFTPAQVGRLDGVSNVKVHFASSRIEVDHDPSRQSVDDLVAAVAKAGYKAKASAF